MAIETDKFGLTDDQKMRLTSVGLTKDANMMGAAPDMYSALWDLCFGESMTINCAKCGGNDHGDGIEHCSKTCPLYNARAALAKASGIITVDMKGNEND